MSGVSPSDRARALQILGLSEGANAGEIRAAHRALRSHIEARMASQEGAAFRAARRGELSELERALSALPLPSAEEGAEARSVPRWILGWAVIASLLVVGLLSLLSLDPDFFGPRVLIDAAGDGAGGDGSGGFAIEADGEDATAAGGGEHSG